MQFIEPLREARREQFAEERADADARKEVAPFADSLGSSLVVPVLGLVERQFHEARKGHRAVARDFFAEQAGERVRVLGWGGVHRGDERRRKGFVVAKIDAFFNLMLEQKASDLHLSSGNPPILRINGELHRVDYPALDSESLKQMLYEITPEIKIKTYEETGDVDFGYEIPMVSRFRANFFNHKYGVAAVFRQIPSHVMSFEDFEKIEAPLPAVLK